VSVFIKENFLSHEPKNFILRSPMTINIHAELIIFISVYVPNVQIHFPLDLVSVYLFIFFLINYAFNYYLGITEFDGKQYHVGLEKINFTKSFANYFSRNVFHVLIVKKALHHNSIPLIMNIYVQHVMKCVFHVNVVENVVR
jgi:hypothetical protein